MTLHPHHLAHLKTSALSNQVIAERGYHSITHVSALTHMAQSQRLVPAIGIPVYALDERYTEITRPDSPRTETKDDGKIKPIKYEWPAGKALVLDLLPRFRDALTDTTVPLWFTEGAKKADALASQEQPIVPISVNGAWGWMDGKDADGNRCLLPDFRHIALRGRRVVLGFDSDYQVNEHVRMALGEFAKALEGRGALVGILQLPHADKKLGLDDALADGWTFAELEQAVNWRDGTTEGDRLRQEVNRLRRANAQQAERVQWQLAALSNSTLGPGERITNVFLKSAVEANSSKADEHGAVPISIMGIGTASGQSPDSVGKHIAKMEKLGVLQRHYSTVIKRYPLYTSCLGEWNAVATFSRQ